MVLKQVLSTRDSLVETSMEITTAEEGQMRPGAATETNAGGQAILTTASERPGPTTMEKGSR